MSDVSAMQEGPTRECIRLSDVDWTTYSRLLRIFAERPDIDDGVQRVGIDIRDREEIPMDADGPRLPRYHLPEGFRIRWFACCAKCHGGREGGSGEQAGDDQVE